MYNIKLNNKKVINPGFEESSIVHVFYSFSQQPDDKWLAIFDSLSNDIYHDCKILDGGIYIRVNKEKIRFIDLFVERKLDKTNDILNM